MCEDIFKEVPLDFAIVGGIRSGTTALWHALKQHPEIRMPCVPDTCMFGRDILKIALKPITPDEYFHMLPRSRSSSVRQLIGDKCSFWLISAYAVEEILRLNDKCKFIVVLRDPLEVLVSLWCFNLYQGLYSSLSLEHALLAENKWRMGIGIPGRVRFLQQLFLTEHIRYGTHMRRLVERVSKENILVIPYDLWRRNPIRTLVRIFDFLGVEKYEVKVKSIGESRVFRWKFLEKSLGLPPVRIMDMIPAPWRFQLWRYKEFLKRPFTKPCATDSSAINFPVSLLNLVREELRVFKSLRLPDMGPVVDRWINKLGEIGYEG